MPGANRVNSDTAGGTNVGGSPNVFVNGQSKTRIGDFVAGHGICPHCGPQMAEGSGTVIVNNIPTCRAGDKATCGCPATGSDNVFIGGPTVSG